MRVEEVMTRDVVTVAPDLPLKDVARTLVERRISGVPVCSSDGRVLGVVSEADILRKEEGIAPDLARPLAWLAHKLDDELDKIEALTAGEAMTAPAVTVRPTQSVSEVARLMVDTMINRVPVVSEGVLVGVVSRADLMRAFVRTDAEIEREIRDDILLRMMLLPPGDVEVAVEQGRVSLHGQTATEQDAKILERCVRRVPGVLGLESHLRWPTRVDRRAAWSRFGP